MTNSTKSGFDYDQYIYENMEKFLDAADWVLNGRQEMPKPFTEGKRNELIQKGREVFFKESK